MAKYLKFKDDLTAGEDLLIEKDVIYPVVSESCSEYSFVDESECLHLYDKKCGDFEVIELVDFEVGQQWEVVKDCSYARLNGFAVGDIVTVTGIFDIDESSPAYKEGHHCSATPENFNRNFDFALGWTDILEGNVKLVGNTDD